MQALFNSFLLVFAGEMGDKTQLLALVLARRYRQPWVILAAIFVATLLNHGLASYAGAWVSTLVSPQTLAWILAGLFFAFALWILVPDKEEELKPVGKWGAFLTTLIAFFIAEMGDKTQMATIALGATYDADQTWLVTVGTTLGMMASNALALFFGEKLLQKIPMKWVRLFACALFVLFGILILVHAQKAG